MNAGLKLGLGVVVGLLWSAPAGAPPVKPTLGVVELRASVVRIVRPSGALGAGVEIEPGVLLTAAHVVAGASSLAVEDSEGNLGFGTVEATDTTIDLAVVRLGTANLRLQPAQLRCEVPRPHEPLTVLGHPFGVGFVGMSTEVAESGTPGPRGLWPEALLASGPAIPGMSGGPLFDTAGAVEGIAVGAFAPTSDPNVGGELGFVPGSAICASSVAPALGLKKGS